MKKACIGAVSVAMMTAVAAGQTSPATDLGNITLFGTEYNVRRVAINEITFPDPVNPAFTIPFTETEGFHYLGGNRVLLSTDAGDDVGSARAIFIEAEILVNPDGSVDRLQHVRTVAAEDILIPFGNATRDLNPSGLTLGPVPGVGMRLFQSSGDEEVFVWDHTAGTLPIPPVDGPTPLPGNTDSEGIEYVAANDTYYTIVQDSPLSILRYTASFGPFTMTALDAPGDIPVGASGSLSGAGDPKGIFDVPDGPKAPADFRGLGGVVIVTLDDVGPSLEAYEYDGTPVSFEPLTQGGAPTGDPLPQFDITSFCLNFGDPPTLQIECGGYDPETGRFFIINQGESDTCAFMYVLQPVCAADLTGSSDPNDPTFGVPDGDADGDDFFFYLDAFSAQTLAICDLTGSSDPNDATFGVPDGDCDGDDFFFYLDLFSQGCN